MCSSPESNQQSASQLRLSSTWLTGKDQGHFRRTCKRSLVWHSGESRMPVQISKYFPHNLASRVHTNSSASSDCFLVYLHTWVAVQKAPSQHTCISCLICAVSNCWPPKLVYCCHHFLVTFTLPPPSGPCLFLGPCNFPTNQSQGPRSGLPFIKFKVAFSGPWSLLKH